MAEFTVTTDLSVLRGLQIKANFDELKAELTKKVESYRTMVVTPETTAAAKTDLANLRRVQKDIDVVRLAWKKEYMAPWDEFEAQCKELKAVLDGGISNLDTQVKKFEEAEVQAKIDELHAYFDTVASVSAAGEIADFEKIRAAHPKWKNRGCSMTEAQNDIQIALAEIERGVNALRNMPEAYKAAMLAKFAENYRLDDAMNVMTQMQRQEAMERARAEREAEARMRDSVRDARTPQNEANEPEREMTLPEAESPAVLENEREEAIQIEEATRRVEFWVEITASQGKMLGDFLRGNGIRYGAIRR